MTLILSRTLLEVSPSIRHAYTAPEDTRDGEDIISTSEWNADHGAPDSDAMAMPGGTLEDSLLIGEFELFSAGNRARKRLPRGLQFRLQTYVFEAAPAGATLRAQYTTDLTEAGGWTDMGASVAVDATGRKVSAWTNLPAPAIAAAEVVLRFVAVAA